MSFWLGATSVLVLAAVSLSVGVPSELLAQTKPARGEPLKIGWISALSGPSRLAPPSAVTSIRKLAEPAATALLWHHRLAAAAPPAL